MIPVFRKPVAEIEYCITRLDNGVIHDLAWPNDAEMEEAFLAIGRTVVTGDAAANVEEQVHTCLFFCLNIITFIIKRIDAISCTINMMRICTFLREKSWYPKMKKVPQHS